MSGRIIDGKAIAAGVRADVAAAVNALPAQPTLAVVLVGDDPASHVYVASKVKTTNEVGMRSVEIRLPAETTQDDLLARVAALSADPEVDGILVQLPLPGHIDERKVIHALRPDKDVDGFHPVNAGRLMLGEPGFQPATPAGIVEMLRRSGIETAGRHAVVVGRSNIVGRPMANLLLHKGLDATVTVCHSRTRELAALTRQADLLIAAIGRPHFVTADMVREGAVVVDVGINRVDDASRERGYRLVGDVDFEAVAPKASWITPVPGGVGPLTIAMLLRNTLAAAQGLYAY